MRVVLAVIAVAALGLAPSPGEELKRVIDQYESSKNLRIDNRVPTILAFGKLKEDGAAGYLEKIFMEELLPEAKEAAIQALVNMETKTATGLLIRIGSKPNFEFQVVTGLGGCDEPEVRDLVYDRGKGKGASKLEERLVAIQVIAIWKDERAREALLQWVKDRRPEVRAAVARALTGFQGEEILDALSALLRDKARQVQVQVIVSLEEWKGEVPKRILALALDNSAWEVRAGAMSMLYGKKDDWVFEEAQDLLLRDKDWHVRAEAVKVLTGIREKRCVPPLIKALGKEKGRMQEDVRRALEELTGLKMSAVAQDWESWWEDNEATFVVKEREEGEDGEGKETGRPRSEKETATYFGQPVLSKKVIFLIDLSQSMKEEYLPPGVKETQVKGGEKDKVKKIDVAKREMSQLIGQLKPNVHFNIFYFNAFPLPWKESLVKATPANRKDALAFVEKGKPSGLTNIYDTLERALGDKHVDTIYLLTDGVPTTGKHKHPRLNEFKMAVAELNRHRRVAINTISFGDQDQSYRWFLEAIAEENFGIYVAR